MLNKKIEERQGDKKAEETKEDRKDNKENRAEQAAKTEVDINTIKAKPKRNKEKAKNVDVDYEVEYDEALEEKPTDVKYINEEDYDD